MIRGLAVAVTLIVAFGGAFAAGQVPASDSPQETTALGVLATETCSLISCSSFEYPGDTDWYMFQVAEQTQSAVLDLRSAISTQVVLFDSDVRYQVAAEGKLRLMLAPGTYYVHIQPQVLSTATYTFVVSNSLESERNDGLLEATVLGTVTGEVPLFVYGALSPAGDLDVFRFDVPAAQADQPIRIETDTPNGDTIIVLYALDEETGCFIPSLVDDDSGSGQASRLYLLNEEPETYYVMVEEDGRDSVVEEYSLSLSVVAPGEGSSTLQEAIDQPLGMVDLNHAIEASGFVIGDRPAFYGFVVEPSTCPDADQQVPRVTIETKPRAYSDDSSDSVIRVYDASGVVIAEDDDSGEERWSRVCLSLEPGVYAVEVAGYMDTARFEHMVSIDMACHIPASEMTETEPNDSTSSANDAPIPVRYSAQISPRSDVDVFEFALETESTLILETSGRSADGDTRLELYKSYDDELILIDWDDDSGDGLYSLLVVSLEPGTYYALVEDYWGDQIYDYTLSILLRE